MAETQDILREEEYPTRGEVLEMMTWTMVAGRQGKQGRALYVSKPAGNKQGGLTMTNVSAQQM